MGNIVIRVENLSKQFRIGMARHSYDTLRDQLVDSMKSILRRKYRISSRKDIIWALKDVSFEVKHGEAVGIIGGNGAGKSTILKILSRITEPTVGRAELYGRVGSLVEVGTGFHGELTGRENIYLNGAILGMKQAEINKRFDEIVAFSEVEKFIDTPVKRYSSGMYVRLGFAVAAYLEPDILIVDEVLSVGDQQFQKKCMSKMDNVAKEGRTVLFVSHNMGGISRLCSRVLWLEEGHLRMDGSPMDVISRYTSSGEQDTGFWTGGPFEARSGRAGWLKHARVLSNNGYKVSTNFFYDEEIKIEIGYELKSRVVAFRSYLLLRDSSGNIIWASHDIDGPERVNDDREPGIYNSTCIFPKRLLRPGRYHVSIGIFGKPRETVEEEHIDVLSFQVSEAGYMFDRDPRMGLLTPCLAWEVVRRQNNNF